MKSRYDNEFEEIQQQQQQQQQQQPQQQQQIIGNIGRRPVQKNGLFNLHHIRKISLTEKTN